MVKDAGHDAIVDLALIDIRSDDSREPFHVAMIDDLVELFLGPRCGIFGAKIVKDQDAKWLKEDATKVMQQWLQSGTKIDLVYAHNDPMALGAYLAASGANKQNDIKFIGIDGLAIPDGGIRAVENGQLAGTFVYPTGAKEAVDTVMNMVDGKEFSSKQVLPTTAVTKDNAAKVYAEYDFSNK